MSAWTAFPGAIQMPHVRTQLLDTAANATRVTQETELFVRRKVSIGKGRNARIIKPCPYEQLKFFVIIFTLIRVAIQFYCCFNATYLICYFTPTWENYHNLYITNLTTVAQKLDRAIRLSMEALQGTQWVTFSNSSYDFRTNCTPLSPIIFF